MKTTLKIANFILVVSFIFWAAETSYFLWLEGWHYKATHPVELLCDEIFKLGANIGTTIYLGLGMWYLNDELNSDTVTIKNSEDLREFLDKVKFNRDKEYNEKRKAAGVPLMPFPPPPPAMKTGPCSDDYNDLILDRVTNGVKELNSAFNDWRLFARRKQGENNMLTAELDAACKTVKFAEETISDYKKELARTRTALSDSRKLVKDQQALINSYSKPQVHVSDK